MDVDEFVARHPQLFHMAEAGAWDGIQQDGLRSTSALLDLFKYSDATREQIESARREQIVTITHPDTGAKVQIRDNKPLRPQFLEACLTDMSPREWYELLNRKVFFWVSEVRLDKLLAARAYRKRPHDVIVFDTRAFIGRELQSITLAPINTGATLYPSASKRGSDTFKSISDYPLAEYIRWRGHADAIVELTVDYQLPRVKELALRVERRQADSVRELLWEP